MVIPEQQNSQSVVLVSPPTPLPPGSSGEEDFNFEEFMQILLRHYVLILLVTLVVTGMGMVYTLLQHKVYESTETILVAANRSGSGGDTNLPILSDLQALTQSRSVETQVEILSSPELYKKAYEAMPLDDRYKGFKREHYWKELDKQIIVAMRKNTDIVTITVHAYNPRSASVLANTIADTYLQQDLTQNRQATRQTRSFVGEQLKKVRKKFDQAANSLADFEGHTGIVAPDAQLTAQAAVMANLQEEIDTTKADTDAKAQAVASMKTQLAGMQATVVTESTVASNPRVDAALGRLDDLTSERTRLLQDYMPTSPEVKAVNASIAAETAHLKDLTATVVREETHSRHPVKDQVLAEYASAVAESVADQARLQTLQNEYDSHYQTIKTMPADQKRLTVLLMDTDIQKNTVIALEQQYQTLLVSEQATLPNIRVVTHAEPDTLPISPKVPRNFALFLLLGLLCSAMVVKIVELMDELIHDQETAEKLTEMTTIGMIHAIKEDEQKIIGADDKRSMLVERFRVLRNNISFSALERKIRLLAVTSSAPGEGKSTCCTNLGIVMAMDGKRVLIIDCDLHRPSVHNLLKTPRGIGLTNVLTGNVALSEAIVTTEYPGLSFLPAGILPPNPAEVLNAQPTRQLFQELSLQYDMVILDCPPCAQLSDVQVIASIVDGMLLLVAIDQALKGGVLHAYHALRQVSAPLIGLIINRVDLQNHRYGYYRYYGKYGYYNYNYTYSQDGNAETPGKKKHRRSKEK